MQHIFRCGRCLDLLTPPYSGQSVYLHQFASIFLFYLGGLVDGSGSLVDGLDLAADGFSLRFRYGLGLLLTWGAWSMDLTLQRMPLYSACLFSPVICTCVCVCVCVCVDLYICIPMYSDDEHLNVTRFVEHRLHALLNSVVTLISRQEARIRPTDRQTDLQTDRQTPHLQARRGLMPHSQTDSQTDPQTDRQPDRQTDTSSPGKKGASTERLASSFAGLSPSPSPPPLTRTLPAPAPTQSPILKPPIRSSNAPPSDASRVSLPKLVQVSSSSRPPPSDASRVSRRVTFPSSPTPFTPAPPASPSSRCAASVSVSPASASALLQKV